jgi:hypothetical protein
MTKEELVDIPWLGLPVMVRKRVLERYRELYGEDSPEDERVQQAQAELADLSAYRLIAAHGGNVGAAIAYAKKHRSRGQAPYPASVLGEGHASWQAAFQRTVERLLYPSAECREKRERVLALVLEEMNKLGLS